MPLITRTVCAGAFLVLGAGSALANCSLSTSPVSFGIYDYRVQSDITGGINVTCDSGMAYSLELSTGNGTFSNRQMDGTSGHFLIYNLYITPSYTQIWGDGIQASTAVVGGSGTGLEVSHPVYGAIPDGQNVAPGLYTDSITVTVRF